MPRFDDLAVQLADTIEDAVLASDGASIRDRNDNFLVAGYVRAHRCFRTIILLAKHRRADDALALTRTLVSIALRSLYLVESDEIVERDLRLQRMKLKLYVERDRMTRELTAAGIKLDDHPDYPPLIAKQEAWFAAVGESPTMLDDASIARKLGMGLTYARVYRPGSEAAHWGLGAMVDSFVELGDPDQPLPVRLEDDPTDDEIHEILGLAIATFGDFALKAEPIMQLGIEDAIDAIGVEANCRLNEDEAD